MITRDKLVIACIAPVLANALEATWRVFWAFVVVDHEAPSARVRMQVHIEARQGADVIVPAQSMAR